MRNKKLFRACMTGILSAAMLATSVPVAAAEFGDGTAVQEAVTAENPNLEETEILAAPEAVSAEETEEPALFSAEAAEVSAKASSVKLDKNNFTDANFLKYVKIYDKDGNGYLSQPEMDDVRVMDVSGKGLWTLKGISNFKNLEELDASNNKLTSKYINLSSNKKLKHVNLSYNKLTTLKLYSTYLVSLDCSHNSLTKITMPSSYKNIEYINVGHNKFTSQKNAGLANISYTKYEDLYEINASNNSLTSFNCSGFEGILELSNNKITTLTGGAEGYQAVAIHLEGKGNTLSKTSKVDFSELGNRVPQRFTCNSAVKSKIVMVTPKVKTSFASDGSKVTVTVGVSDPDAVCTLYRKAGSGSYTAVKTWEPGELDDPEFGENTYVDTNVRPGTTYTYKMKATVKVQDRARNPISWSREASASAKYTLSTPASFTGKSSSKRTATLSWKGVSGATSYNVYMGTSKSNMKSMVYATKTSTTKTKLTSGKTYYFKVRAAKKIDGKVYYSSFSPIKSIKIK